MSQQDLEALHDELQRSIEALNSECDKHHQPLTDKIKDLKTITDELETVHKATTIGSLVGSTVGATAGVVGGIALLVGLFLAPFTFGATLALTAVGVAGVAGGVTGAASNVTNMVKQKNLREIIEIITNDFVNTVNPIIQHLDKIKNTMEKLQEMEETYSVQNKIIMTSVRSLKTVAGVTKIASTIGDVVAKTAKIFKTVGKLSAVITSVFVPLDIYSIVKDSIEISEINQSEIERREEEIKSETVRFIHRMRKTAVTFQNTLDGIKSARDIINEELQTSNS